MQPHRPASEPAVGVAETHSSIVFFVGDRAYKLKKAVDLGFLDFTTREARAEDCRREVALNRRLSPDVYLGVADLFDENGRRCDHLVVMKRLPGDRRLSTLVTEGVDVSRQLGELATRLARFHEGARRGSEVDAAASVGAAVTRWRDDIAVLRSHTPRVFEARTVDRLEQLAMSYLQGRASLFDDRIAAGRAVDGHGDLLAADVFLLEDGPRVLDCLEFDEGLRCGDGLADVAFLAMDLEHLGRADLADQFLAQYRVAARDEWPPSLAHLYIAERACIRSKVGAIRADQSVPEAVPEARAMLVLALAHLERAEVKLVLVGGAPGTGKSKLARGLAPVLEAEVLRTDELRKELLGLPVDHRAPASAYATGARAEVYGELLRRAAALLAGGRSVILDASWALETWRDGARRVADETNSRLVELRCDAPAHVTEHRLIERARRPDVSDADAAVAAAWQADPWEAASTIDTSGSPDESLRTAAATVEARL
jgi:aminoglycoside phosphotransferase family enzyme/predicted kinase